MRRPPVPPTAAVRAAAAVVAGALLASLAAHTAAAAPGDPATGWDSRPEEAHREVAVSDTGRVVVDASSEAGYEHVNYLEVGEQGEWVRTPDTSGHLTHLAAGPEDYAVSVWHDADGPARYRVLDGADWSEPATFHDGPVHASDLVSNADGDVAVLLRLHHDGGTLLARLPRGGTWTVQEVPGVATDLPAAVALNDAGKTTVVWAAPSGVRSTVLRSVVREGSTQWSAPQTVGVVNDPAPNLSMVTDGEGRETVVGGNLLWRQPSTSKPLAYRMRTSTRAQLTAGHSATRVVWPAGVQDRYEVRSVLFDDETQRPQTTLWSHPMRECAYEFGLNSLVLGVGMVPGGRTYLAVAVRRGIDTDGTCPDVARFLAVDRRDRVLGDQPLGSFTVGKELQVAAGAAGPVAVEFKNWDDDADPLGEDQPDGLYSLEFFHR